MASLGASGGAFIGARGRMAAWHEMMGRARPGGKTVGAAVSLSPAWLAVAPAAPAVEKCRRVEAYSGGRARFCGLARDFPGAGQLACRRWDRTEGGERREKVMGLRREKQNQRGPG
jgi:hypothetical protein